MRSFMTLLAAASIFAIGALAAPANEGRTVFCLTDSDAKKVANNFQQSIANYSDALALSAFTSDFTDYSDSVIELINNGCPNKPIPLGSATFSSRADFMAGQGKQPPIPFEQLNLWHTCNSITLRWKSAGPAQGPSQVTGILVIEVVNQNLKWLIKKVYSEFNSGAWLVNLGVFKPTCSS